MQSFDIPQTHNNSNNNNQATMFSWNQLALDLNINFSQLEHETHGFTYIHTYVQEKNRSEKIMSDSIKKLRENGCKRA